MPGEQSPGIFVFADVVRPFAAILVIVYGIPTHCFKSRAGNRWTL
jgi:hypothetical protein